MQRFIDLIAENIRNLNFERSKIDKMIEELDKADGIFVVGVGRSGFVARAFAMRLMHLGYRAFVIGETITPRIEKKDTLIAISGSGETGYVVAIAKKAKELGAKVIAITSSQTSTLAKLSDLSIPLKSKFGKEIANIAPLGTIFELTAMVFFDSIIAEIMERKKLKEEDLAKRHSIENEVVV
ncbi:MAG: 6-phospho-3-hexuloisomerase [Archaeoglobaceae archaeon]|nr:6-phospho-3-hexuloisomerase [Archaeoglobaceae archaeon]MDW8117463.1 6-phospho-3-hexuloisomerase [Archaeoglobaceae archaeon]